MFVKEHNSNRYVFVKYDDFACRKSFFDELIRIQYNKVYTYPNTVELLEQVKQGQKKVHKQSNQRT
jgi:hypothetical protein